jgi:hypothetical protein
VDEARRKPSSGGETDGLVCIMTRFPVSGIQAAAL